MNFNKEKNKIIVWGLRTKYHTHRYIHKAFYENAKKLGYNTIWVEDEQKNTKYIESGDLIITAGPVGKMIPEKFTFEDYNLPVRDDVFYCLHNIKDIFREKLNRNNYINLQVYRDSYSMSKNTDQWGPVTFFDKETKTLYQPWGTDLLAQEFKKPTFNKNKFVFWVGSIWNDKNNHGNLNEIATLKRILEKLKLRFINVRFVPDFINILLVRISRIAPAIAGRQQVETNYLPCRMFKNISYGQLGFSNIKKFNDILIDCNIYSEDMETMVSRVLSLSENEYKSIIQKQQEIVKNYTYKNALENIIKAFQV